MPSDTIPRNSRLIPGLKDRLAVCLRFDADNQYRGQPVDPKYAWAKLLEGDKARRCRLSFDGDGVYTIHVHGRLWYELRETAPGHLTTDARRRVRATEGSRAGQRGIVDGPPEQSIWLPITWDDGRTETYHAASVATVTDDPVCATGEGCHMRFDGTVWYAVDSEVGAHTHELPGWAAEEYEHGAGAGDKREHETERAAAEADDELMIRGAEGSLRDPADVARYQQAVDRGQVLRTFAPPRPWKAPEPGEAGFAHKVGLCPCGLSHDTDAVIELNGAYSLWPEPGGRGPALAPPEPTEASVRAVLEAVGIRPADVGGAPVLHQVVIAALKRGWVRGHEDTLIALSGDET